MHHLKRRHQLSTISAFICYFSCIQWFVLRTKWPGNWKHYKWTLKKLKLGMVSSFHPHRLFKKVEWVTAKTGCTSFTNWTISFEVFRFLTKLNSSVTKAFHFFKLITTPDFLCIQYAPFKATPSTFNHFCLHFLFFMHSMICFEN